MVAGSTDLLIQDSSAPSSQYFQSQPRLSPCLCPASGSDLAQLNTCTYVRSLDQIATFYCTLPQGGTKWIKLESESWHQVLFRMHLKCLVTFETWHSTRTACSLFLQKTCCIHAARAHLCASAAAMCYPSRNLTGREGLCTAITARELPMYPVLFKTGFSLE